MKITVGKVVPVEQTYFRVPEAAKYMRISPSFVYLKIEKKELPAIPTGDGRRGLLLKKKDIDNWLERRRQAAEWEQDDVEV